MRSQCFPEFTLDHIQNDLLQILSRALESKPASDLDHQLIDLHAHVVFQYFPRRNRHLRRWEILGFSKSARLRLRTVANADGSPSGAAPERTFGLHFDLAFQRLQSLLSRFLNARPRAVEAPNGC